ncbi:MAG: ribosome maturation factor RimM, partial [Chlorobi bacterium]|nr:ribosome maturation factor RimM [Chlorobiota bacterium]
MKEEREMCQIGRVLRPHGIRGEVKVQVFSDTPDRFRLLDHVYVLNGEDTPRKLEILSTRNQGDHALLTFADVTDREAAES